MTLQDAQSGKEYIIEESMLRQPQKRRLEAMGLIEGTIIRKINEALDGSVIFIVRGTRLALGKELANDIIIREITPEDINNRRRRRGRGLINGHSKGTGKGLRNGHGRGVGMGLRDGHGKGNKEGRERGK